LFDTLAIQPRWLVLSRPVARIAGLPQAWDGATISLLTDLHAGWFCGVEYIRRAVAISNASRPDIVLLGGDQLDGPPPAGLAEALADLQARDARLAVLGNHDYTKGLAGAMATMQAAGIEVLVNRHRILLREGQPLCLAGVDDLRQGHPDFRAALAGMDADTPRIVLAHNPDCAEKVPPDLRVDLMLSGHTHGGQIRPPFGPAPFLSLRRRKYAQGMVQGPRCLVYISRGVGMSHLPLRWNCRPEMPLLTLRRR
jgi:predicted MPP superfamily phosphohydrolase